MKVEEAIDAAAMAFSNAAFNNDEDDALTNARAAFLASLRANGFAIVPLEPTREMLFALITQWESNGGRTIRDNYAAMLAAAQGDEHE